jgi:hypothetical protein
LYLKAALVAAVSLFAFILVTKAAWPSNVLLFRAFAGWCRTLPDKWKRYRDPVYRRRMETVDQYESVFGGLVALSAQRMAYQRKRGEAQGDFGVLVLDAFIDEVDLKTEGMRLIAVEFMRRLGDDGIAAIADRINAETFGGRASAADIRAFIEEERDVIVGSPHLAAGHAQRLIRRFAQLAPPADAPAST